MDLPDFRLSPVPFTLVVIAIATVLQWLTFPSTQLGPFIIYYPAMVICAVYGSAPLALVVTVLLANFLFIEQKFLVSPYVWLFDFLYIGSGLLIWRLSYQIRANLKELAREKLRGDRFEAELSTTLKNVGDSVISINLQGKITFMNLAAETATGWSSTDAWGRPLHEVFHRIHETTRRDLESPVAKVLIEGREVESAEHTSLIRRDGSEIAIEDHGAPIRDSDGTLLGAVLIFRDVTQERAEKIKIYESERLFQHMADTAPVLVWLSSPDNQGTWFNKTWLDFTGKVIDQEMGEGWRAGVHPDDFENSWNARQQAAKVKEAFTVEYRLRRHDGEYRWLMDRGVPRFTNEGFFLGYIGSCIDITEKKKIERALIASEEYFRALVDHSPSILWLTNPAGECVYLSKQWYDVTGQDQRLDLAYGWLRAIHPDDRERIEQEFSTANSKREVVKMEYRLRTRQGEYRWVLDSGHPRWTEDGQYLGCIGTVVDVHERKEAEQDLQRAIRARDEFLSLASHELKTPLTALKLQVQIRQRSLDKGQTAMFATDKIPELLRADARQIDRLSFLIDDMLDISRITTGRFRMNPETFELCDVVEEAVERMRPQLEAAKSEVRLEHCEKVVGQWDRERLQQVILSLLANAVRFGEGRPIDISVKQHNGIVELEVSDHGKGIAERDYERIFERFERAITDREIGGLGLGLFITKQIVKAHGGDITVSSKLGDGSTFRVTLPIGIPEPSPGEATSHGDAPLVAKTQAIHDLQGGAAV